MKNEAGLQVTGIRIIVRRPVLEKLSAGGIALPDTLYDAEQRAQITGTLIDGTDEAFASKEMQGIKRGDQIAFARYSGAGFEWVVGKREYVVMNAIDVVGKVDQEPDSQFRSAITPIEPFCLAEGYAKAVS